MLPVEFARISDDGRLTVVIHPESEDIRALWAEMSPTDLDEARHDLAKREGTSVDCIGFADNVHARTFSRFPDPITGRISEWLSRRPISAVIWTDLPSNFETTRKVDFSEEHLIEYLQTLRGETRKRAKDYVAKAPQQISTVIRRRLESEFAWYCEADDSLLEGQA